MPKLTCSKIFLALAATLLVSGPTSAGPIEDHSATETVKFRSKSDDVICTGYRVFSNLFVTKARCLSAAVGNVTGVRELDFVDEGVLTVEVFALKPEENVLFLKNDSKPHRRFVRAGNGVETITTDDTMANITTSTMSGAAFLGNGVSLMGATLILLVL